MAVASLRCQPPSGFEHSENDEVDSKMGNGKVVAASRVIGVHNRVWQLVLVLGGQHDVADEPV